jgi:hypothetical protein
MATKEIKVKIGADVDGLNKGMSSAEASLARFAKVGAASVVAVGVAMVALTKASMDNIDVLAKQARSLGLTTAAFQKMALVAGEAGIEAGKLSSMLGLMQRNIVELSNGTQAQVDSFNALGVSLADLKGLSPDEQFAKIADALSTVGDPAEKTALAMEVFGRSGRDAINMLNGYGEASANAAEFQNRFGIAVSQATSDNVERANDAVGRLGMVMEGLGNTMAGAVAPALESVANGLIAFAGGVIGAKVTLEEFFGTLEHAREALGEDFFNRLVRQPDKIVAMGPILEKIATEVQRLAIIAPGAAAGLERIEYHFNKMGQIGAADVMRQYKDELENASAAHEAGTITGEEYREKVVSINDRVNDLIASFYDVDSVQFGALNAELSGLKTWIDSVASSARAMAEALPMGMDTGTGLTNTGDAFDLLPPGEGAVSTSPRPRRPSVDSYGNFLDASQDKGADGGGGISSAEKVREDMAARLEALMEGMMTEQETVAEWYEQNRTLLEDARAAELLTEQEFQTQRERLEKEHQDRLSKIKELGAMAGLNTVLGAGAEILNAMGSNSKKALRIAKVFGAAQALIGALQGASEALKLPFPGNLAAAATVLAKGMGFVAAIKGVNESGGAAASSGGGSTGGASSAATAAPAQQPATTFAFTLQNDPMGFGESFARQLIDQLNSTQRNGGQIRGVLA